MLEKNDLIQLKARTLERLQEVNVEDYALDQTDIRLKDYVKSAISHPDDHNLYELLSILRFFRLLDAYIFKPTEVKKFIVFYENLKFSGLKGRVKYRLTPIQVFQFANILGFYRTPEKRLCRDALLFVPRKYSKTTSVASLAIYDLLFGDANAQAYVAANSYDQAQICFGEIKNILKSLDKRFKNFKINREQVFSKRRGRTSFARCLASNPDKLDGLNASTVILDEFSQADSAELKNVLTSSMGARVNPMTIVITTASDKLESPFVNMLNSYKAVLRGEVENDSIFAHIFEPDVNDAEDDPHTWAKVQPHLGITVQADYYENEYRKAQMTAEDMLTFRTKLLNLFVQDEAKVWFTSGEIEAMCKDDNDLKTLKNRPDAMVAVDLSVCDDFSSVSYNIYLPEIKMFHIHNDYYFPRKMLISHPNRELYERWAADGYLRLCDGNVIDYRMIVNDINARNRESIRILNIGYDPYKSMEFVNMMGASGAKKVLQPIKQTYGTFTSPVESFEIAARTGRVTFNYNPINWYCFGNAVIDEDRLENRKPIKKSQNAKIDGAVTSVMTFYLYNNFRK
ncbi:terminase large subunit domain-containing protein [Bacteroides thetaiotaomicron]|jgi:phage terminase large subunit-like protein|uniref:Terminase large subunit n=1 Tax=Bacteroides thetaiotaomicron TaxID=818 RepID=A0A139JU83_BACT4|nr:terminase large subunit [Bacteroides thetaiotaomicron]DAK10547.1 MAG TPA: Large Terminase [Caudoviricetes sp.]KAB4458059.1 terminase large subunit [Bacteroides thetaiotaomicron]KXT30537.1 putative phage terminase, large subunit [Bacteroides thetaiotaomicron]MCA6026932.1 terminase large subunit [Bacteroides thetaiotaomicron]MCE9148458.1 terminase large subunit [Bacteroides thetaiotaomicron]